MVVRVCVWLCDCARLLCDAVCVVVCCFVCVVCRCVCDRVMLCVVVAMIMLGGVVMCVCVV